ncbi:hypothetical protein [Halalkalirubrum salinum]|uniref:hypothetical protein n=1 Tax=Halalkalirubrum salinum TaxID=2563889 RepID=UPI00148533A8|nr:hypothetical protein [Halalkalirubrum salinum]
MPDTKSGRERKGRNKRAQLERQLNKQELRALEGEEEPPEPAEPDSEFLTEPDELDE